MSSNTAIIAEACFKENGFLAQLPGVKGKSWGGEKHCRNMSANWKLSFVSCCKDLLVVRS